MISWKDSAGVMSMSVVTHIIIIIMMNKEKHIFIGRLFHVDL